MSDGSVWVFIPLAAIAAGTLIALKRGQGNTMSSAKDDETIERIGSLAAQNGALQSRIDNLEARVQTLEKIATDPARRLANEIERL